MAEQSSPLAALTTKILDCLLRAEEWKRSWDIEHPDAAQVVSGVSPYISPSEDFPTNLFGLPLHFSNLDSAKGYAYYHLICFFLLSILSHKPLLSPQQDPYSLSMFPLNVSPEDQIESYVARRRQAAVEICRAIPYHLRSDLNGCRGVLLIMYPMNTTMAVFTPGSEEGKWITRCQTRIKDKWALEPGYSGGPRHGF